MSYSIPTSPAFPLNWGPPPKGNPHQGIDRNVNGNYRTLKLDDYDYCELEMISQLPIDFSDLGMVQLNIRGLINKETELTDLLETVASKKEVHVVMSFDFGTADVIQKTSGCN